jgi:hypothetical protein
VIDEARVILELTNLRQVSEIMERMHTAHGQLLEFAVHSPNLSDSFITLTGHGLRSSDDRGLIGIQLLTHMDSLSERI